MLRYEYLMLMQKLYLEPKLHSLQVFELYVKEFLLDNQDELDGFDQGGTAKGNAVYSYSKAKSCGFMMRMIVLRYGFKASSPENMRTLAHECLHVCQEFLPQFLNRDEEVEAEAYFHSYLMESIYKLFL